MAATVRFTQRAEFSTYLFNAEQTVDVLVTLRAEQAAAEEARAPVCVSAALDKSGSMHHHKLSLVKSTMQFAVRQLGESDKLGVVVYDSNVDEIFPLTAATAEAKQRAETAVSRVRSGSATNLSGGLFRSIQQLRDENPADEHGNPGPVSSVLLLTDGLMNQGISDPAALETALTNTLSSGPPIKLHTFGYGNDHNANLLRRLAEIGGGNYYYIEKDDDVPTFFADALGGLISVVVQNAAAEISAAPGVTIEKVMTGLKSEAKENGVHVVSATDLYAEERKDIMVRLKIPGLDAATEAQPLLNVSLSYFDVNAGGTVTTEAVVSTNRVAEVEADREADQDFLEQRLRIDVGDAFAQAAVRAEQFNDMPGAQALLGRAANRVAVFGAQSSLAAEAGRDLQKAIKLCGKEKGFGGGTHSFWSMTNSYACQRNSSYARSKVQQEMIPEAKAFVASNVSPPFGNSATNSQPSGMSAQSFAFPTNVLAATPSLFGAPAPTSQPNVVEALPLFGAPAMVSEPQTQSAPPQVFGTPVALFSNSAPPPVSSPQVLANLAVPDEDDGATSRPSGEEKETTNDKQE